MDARGIQTRTTGVTQRRGRVAFGRSERGEGRNRDPTRTTGVTGRRGRVALGRSEREEGRNRDPTRTTGVTRDVGESPSGEANARKAATEIQPGNRVCIGVAGSRLRARERDDSGTWDPESVLRATRWQANEMWSPFTVSSSSAPTDGDAHFD